MANPEHLSILNRGVNVWNKWRTENPSVRPNLATEVFVNADLTGANLGEADLTECNFANCKLLGANLNASNLGAAVFGNADLTQANLSGADLIRAEFANARLREAAMFRTDIFMANFRNAQMQHAVLMMANIRQSDFSGADLTGTMLMFTSFASVLLDDVSIHDAQFENTLLSNLDLRNISGLNAVGHRGPSSVGIDTIYRSAGGIPHEFLRGAGVPDVLIEYARSLVGKPIQFYSCFISYSTNDQACAERIHADLQASGVRSWFAPHRIQGGKKLYEQVDEAIRFHDRLLLILSKSSMHSEWVKTEIAHARHKELRTGRRVLFPIRLVPFEEIAEWKCPDTDTGKDSAREIREYFIPDFSNWRDRESYQQAFQRLVRDLKTEDWNPGQAADPSKAS
jgi:uncharacterized protein YjbI with pentapeptide repeats